MIYTVFDKDGTNPPQDFPTYKDAKEFADKCYPDGGYSIEATEGECL